MCDQGMHLVHALINKKLQNHRSCIVPAPCFE